MGDYAIITIEDIVDKELDNFFKNNIGKITEFEDNLVVVKYDNLSELLNNIEDNNNVTIFPEEILYWSKDKKELELLLQTNKYNL